MKYFEMNFINIYVYVFFVCFFYFLIFNFLILVVKSRLGLILNFLILYLVERKVFMY